MTEHRDDKHSRPRGDYVRVDGHTYPVTGARQSRQAAALVRAGSFVPISRWCGAGWTDTGTELRGTRTEASK